MWLDYIKDNRGDDVLIMIIGNKIDHTEARAVST
jgi:GTPase SAR1 family protein